MIIAKVMVAMSGGVDSSVAALLLKQQGYEVIGVTMQIWPEPEDSSQTCCSLSAVSDARRVCWQLDIPHYVLNFRDEFEEKVIRKFCLSYLEGRTPNPCIDCNQYIKFESFLSQALSMGADYIATGHYARIMRNENGLYVLANAVDETKDQTYALYRLNQQQLAHVLFPLGELTKHAVRDLARQYGLPVAEKAESQEICFVTSGKYGEFIENYIGQAPIMGHFKHVSGLDLGPHRGIHKYTIGQRKGLGLALGRPVFVTHIDPQTGTVWVGEANEVYHRGLIAEDASYVLGHEINVPTRVTAKIRYKAPEAPAVALSLPGNRLQVEFEKPQRAITPGQAVVLYYDDMVIGGGVIAESYD